MRKRLLALIVAVAALVGGVLYYRAHQQPAAPSIVTAAVSRGDVVEKVDATGTLQAVTTVQVGTQVSGTIKALHADFNSKVRRGQVIAQLDPALFQTQVDQAKATVSRLEAERQRAEVQLADANVKLKRARDLSAQQLISASDLDAAESAAREAEAGVVSAKAQVVQAQASLNQAQVNLDHTVITAPIDGIVISRNVDVGQTVAASMQAPTLFVLARDLTQMQVNASVAESDVGRIEPGQKVSFKVDAYPNQTFTGVVEQVRLQPVVEQNVVSYVTVIDVPNLEMRLKPGMTANVTIETARADSVLRVPNSALRIRPSAEVLAALGQPAPDTRAEARTDEADWNPPNQPQGTTGSRPAGNDGSDTARRAEVWVMADGRLVRVPVRVGLSDGTTSAIVGGALREGDAVVTSIGTGSAAGAPAGSSPLLPFGGRFPGGARRGGGAGAGGGGNTGGGARSGG